MRFKLALLGLICIAILVSGCLCLKGQSRLSGALQLQDEKARSVDSLNTCIETQKSLALKVNQTMEKLNQNISYYNSALQTGNPDYDSLIQNLSFDRAEIDSWSGDLSSLDREIGVFAANSSGLNDEQQVYADRILEHFRAYHTDVQNAQMDYTMCIESYKTYLQGLKNGAGDDDMRIRANNCTAMGNAALQSADAHVGIINDNAMRLDNTE